MPTREGGRGHGGVVVGGSGAGGHATVAAAPSFAGGGSAAGSLMMWGAAGRRGWEEVGHARLALYRAVQAGQKRVGKWEGDGEGSAAAAAAVESYGDRNAHAIRLVVPGQGGMYPCRVDATCSASDSAVAASATQPR
eukprot:jgi/Undpi1/3229/HiC_scaffold_15.g06603.m1